MGFMELLPILEDSVNEIHCFSSFYSLLKCFLFISRFPGNSLSNRLFVGPSLRLISPAVLNDKTLNDMVLGIMDSAKARLTKSKLNLL